MSAIESNNNESTIGWTVVPPRNHKYLIRKAKKEAFKKQFYTLERKLNYEFNFTYNDYDECKQSCSFYKNANKGCSCKSIDEKIQILKIICSENNVTV
jgi:hypothetical protein